MQIRIGESTVELIEIGPGRWSVDGTEVHVEAGPAGAGSMHLLVDGRSSVVTLDPQGDGRFRATIRGLVMDATVRDARALLLERYGIVNGAEVVDRTVRSPMPGMVVRVLVEVGDAVEAGQGVVVLEAMKMENELKAPAAGTVGAVHARPGNAVGKNQLLVEID